MDFLEKHFNNIVKHLLGIGGVGFGLGLVGNMTNVIMDGALDKFSFSPVSWGFVRFLRAWILF